jgi:hypothetical protein
MNWPLLKTYLKTLVLILTVYSAGVLVLALLSGSDRQCGFLGDVIPCSHLSQVRFFLPFIVYPALFLFPVTIILAFFAVLSLFGHPPSQKDIKFIDYIAVVYLILSLGFVTFLIL